MSVIFGICRQDGSAADEKYLHSLGRSTSLYGRDGTRTYTRGQVGMAFQAFHTDDRSRSDEQPRMDHAGNILVFDGRLDNTPELTTIIGLHDVSVSNSTVIFNAFARWGPECFSRFVGDWALALWSAVDSTLYLARDHAGSRTLFYQNDCGKLRWSTYLDTFVAEGRLPQLSSAYLARFLAVQGIRDLTPFTDVFAVPSGHYLAMRGGRITLKPHWRWIADSAIEYRSEADYDEHFLHLFRQAVHRRVGSGAPILAELSGGMDSSSIVCIADGIAREDCEVAGCLDTVSYHDPNEPDWDELPYFTIIERHRNKTGIHLDCSSRVPSYEPLILEDRICPYPGGDSNSIENEDKFERSVGRDRYRVILSGIGGDELLGGVPTPMPELAHYFRAGKFLKLFLKAEEWSLVSRQPLFRTLFDAARFTGQLYGASRADRDTIPPWLNRDLHRICLLALPPHASTRDLISADPCALSNGETWWGLLETLPHFFPRLQSCYEHRYPYLDRDLVEFLHRIPRDQLVRPGRRRLLMRRALRGIVPNEVIERKRKAFISRGPITHLRNAEPQIERLFSSSQLAANGLIDEREFLRAFRTELAGDLRWISHLSNAIAAELWLRGLNAQHLNVRFGTSDHSPFDEVLPAPTRANKLRGSNAENQQGPSGNLQQREELPR